MTQYIDHRLLYFLLKKSKQIILYFTVQLLYNIVQYMNKNKKTNIDHFNILRKIDQNNPKSQRELAKELELSLGKLNYCLKALQKKGLVKFKNFKANPNKLNYLYILTPKGITKKTKLTLNFLKQKMIEYKELEKEIKKQ